MGNTTITLVDVISELSTSGESPVYVVDPSPQALNALVQEITAHSNPPATRMLLNDKVLKIVQEEFWLASSLVELLETEHHEARVTMGRDNELLLAETKLWNLITIDSEINIVSSDESQSSIAGNIYEHYAARWSEYEHVSMRIPPLDHVRSSLRESFGDEFESEFLEMIQRSTSQKIGDGIGVTAICLLLGARHGELLYDISKWGEDSGVASKATFSRMKNTLTDAGLIDTEKVPIDVGRPRLRLLLSDDTLNDVPPEDLLQYAKDTLT